MTESLLIIKKYLSNLFIFLGFVIFFVKPTDASGSSQCQVVINEFVSAKQTHLKDEDEDYPDWIEIYNCQNKTIHLNNWALSDKKEKLDLWQFPDITLDPKGYLLIYASGKNKREASKPLHTNFKIDASGEALFLTDTEQNIIDQTPAVTLQKNQSLNRYPDGSHQLFYNADPTPAKSNSKSSQPYVSLAPIKFSHSAGFYEENFELSLSHEDPEVAIYYTLDGSIPNPSNLQGKTYRYKNKYLKNTTKLKNIVNTEDFLYREYITYRYQYPIVISDQILETDRISQISTTQDEKPDYFPKAKPAQHWLNDIIDVLNKGIEKVNNARSHASRLWYRLVKQEKKLLIRKQYIKAIPYYQLTEEYQPKGVSVRALAVNDKGEQSPLLTKTFFVKQERQSKLPIVALTIPEDDLFDYERGRLVAGQMYDDWIKQKIKNQSTESDLKGNWDWRSEHKSKMQGNIEIFLEKNNKPTEIFNGFSEFRVHGRSSRTDARNKSIRVYQDDSAILNTLLNEDIKVHRINLRNTIAGAGNRSYLTDPVLQEISHGLAFGTQLNHPVVSYLNGEYQGLYFATERKDHYYLANHFDIQDKEVDLLKMEYEVDRGSNEDYLAFIKAVEQMRKSEVNKIGFYHWLSDYIDINSFIDYFITEIYFANVDWPHNNIAYWRYRGDDKVANTAKDGRWRWLMYDMDRSFGGGNKSDPGHDTLTWATEHENDDYLWSRLLLKTFLQNFQFREKFIIRFNDLLNTTFDAKRTLKIATDIKNLIKDEMPRHIERWQEPSHMNEWDDSTRLITYFLEKRPNFQQQHLQDFFHLNNPYILKLNVNALNMGTIKLNSLHLGINDKDVVKPVAASTLARHMEKSLAFPWEGSYFKEMPIKLEAIAKQGYQFSYWETDDIELTTTQKNNPILVITPKTDLNIKAVYREVKLP